MSPKKWSDMPPSGVSYVKNGNDYYFQWYPTNENQNESPPGRPTNWEALGLDSNFGYDDYYYTVNVLIKDINDNILFNWENIHLGKASEIQINGKMTYKINISQEGKYQINVNARTSSDIDSRKSAFSENIFITYPHAPTLATGCFTKDAKLETDQGLIELYKVDSKVHTVDNKRIKGVSKCIFSMDKIIVIEKDAFEKDKPSKKTIVSPFHVFIINNEEKVICDCIDNKKIYLEKYNTDDILYNPILENEEDIKINNMLVKSLTHNCLLARMYDGSSSPEQIKKIGDFLNDYHSKLKNKPNKTILDYRM